MGTMDYGLSLIYANTQTSMREGRGTGIRWDTLCDHGPGQLLSEAVCLHRSVQCAGGKGVLILEGRICDRGPWSTAIDRTSSVPASAVCW